jgi:hypothetical protein
MLGRISRRGGAIVLQRRLRAQSLALALGFGALCAGAAWPALAAPPRTTEDWRASSPTSEADRLATWVVASRDNRGLPFAIVDKVAAEVRVFDAEGQLQGVAPALLGSAFGDDSAPGVGDRELSDILPEERTTPAGRFMAAYGPATGGKKVLWVDYATAISLHPVVDTNRAEQRPSRLRSPSPDDNRITYGCINVAAPFYDEVVRPTFSGTEGVVYVLPEATPLKQVLPAFAAYLDRASRRAERLRPWRGARGPQ